MKFKKLEVYGFKSFADKLTVLFGDGITAIVGPNGCGKSNVADCIKWVLGEQSPKTLRGGSMTDVIFKGTETRKSLSYCEVSLYFDNSDRALDLDFDEVVISRKLYRSGESEYYINKTSCRLKDIVNLLHSSGLGRSGYAIIGQGRIDELLSAKPENRRSVFEDAAGITKYKLTKIENERKLERAEEKMATAIAIINELEKGLPNLKTQAEKAEKFLELKERQKYYDINNYIVQYETTEGKKAEHKSKLDQIQAQINEIQSQYETVSQGHSGALEKASKLDEQIKELNAKRLEYSLTIERAQSESKLLSEKINYLYQQNDRLSSEIKAFDEEYRQSMKALEENHARRKEIDEQTAALRAELDELNNKYIELTDKLTRREGEAEKSRSELFKAMSELSDIKANMSKMQEQSRNLADKIRENTAKADSLDSAITDDEIKLIMLEKTIVNLNEKLTAIKTEYDKVSADYEKITKEQKATIAEADDVMARYHEIKSEYRLMSDIHNDMRNFSESVKTVVNAAVTEPELKGKVEGVVARVIQVSPKYEIAIEMALGAAAQNIITPTENDAKALIEYLKRNKAGRATFLPMTAVKPRSLPAEARPYLRMKGCLGIASDLIGYSPRYDNVIKSLLGATVIAEDLDSAIAFSKATDYSLKVVTLQGEVINPRGAITGGSLKTQAANLVGSQNRINELKAKLDEYEAHYNVLSSQKLKQSLEAAKLQSSLKNLEKEIHNLEVELARENQNHDKLTKQIQYFKSEKQALLSEIERNKTTLSEIDERIKSADRLEAEINLRKAASSSAADENRKEFEQYKSVRDELHQKITNTKVAIAGLVGEHNAVDNEIVRLKHHVTQLALSIENNKAQIAKNNEVINAAAVPDNVNADQADIAKKLEEVNAKLEQIEREKEECSRELVELDRKRQDLQSQLMALSEQKFKEEKAIGDIELSFATNTQKIEEEYGLTYEQCKPLQDSDYNYNKGRIEASRLKKEIINIGYVNPESIEEYKALKARVDEEHAQKDDLEKSIADIRKVIREMEEEMLTRFNEAFEQIKQNFSIVFRQLFGGGNAKLVLEDAENPLEAGIEIIAEPPGKKLQSISLLSGGERALTAIAILFAILKMRPVPFCVFDEIEAALDDANAERFAKYLNKFSKDTQFIVITHRKPTMELADRLYGVTMEEKGVSKVISVQLEEAVQHISQAN